MKEVKYAECPMCRQSMVDLSNDPRFVNHNPDGDSSKPSSPRRDLPPSGASFDGPLHSGVGGKLPHPDREPKKLKKNDADDAKNVNFPKKEVSKDNKKEKMTEKEAKKRIRDLHWW